MKNIRAVIDANIFISCLLKSPSLTRIYQALKEDKFRLIISERLLNEIKETFREKELKIDPASFQELIAVIKLKAIMVKPTVKINVCRDPEDNFIIEMAIAAQATHIVTRDKDLLELKSLFKDIPILSPEDFLYLL